jgi:hypothetical protein
MRALEKEGMPVGVYSWNSLAFVKQRVQHLIYSLYIALVSFATRNQALLSKQRVEFTAGCAGQ